MAKLIKKSKKKTKAELAEAKRKLALRERDMRRGNPVFKEEDAGGRSDGLVDKAERAASKRKRDITGKLANRGRK